MPVFARLLTWLVERADRGALRAMLATLERLPCLGPVVSFRIGDLQAARRGLERWPGVRFDWQVQLSAKVGQMLASPTAASAPVRTARPRPVQRILYVVDVAPGTARSGYTLRTAALTDALRVEGLQVQVLARFPNTPGISDAVPSSPFEPDMAAIERHAAALARIIENERIDVVHAVSPYANGLAANLAAARCGIASIYEARGLWHRTRAMREPLYAGSTHHAYCERQELHACAGATVVVALSDPMAQWMREAGVPADRVVVIGNAANVRSTPPPRATAQGPQLRLGYAGALVAYEGIDGLLQALAGDSLRCAHLQIAGDGAERPALERLAARLGLGPRVRFLGVLEEGALDEFYAALDAVVLPRVDVPLTRMVPAMKPFDALAHGVPVLLSAAAAAAVGNELLARDDVGVFGSIHELPDVWARLQTRGGRWVPPPSWPDRARMLVDVYARAMHG